MTCLRKEVQRYGTDVWQSPAFRLLCFAPKDNIKNERNFVRASASNNTKNMGSSLSFFSSLQLSLMGVEFQKKGYGCL